ncbi:caspase, EACC1-associated type [Microcoleus sp. herbarium2]|uniref:caspase, EACC1-associated type n=1 Tax=Microcoleus sp. herbarium2 TaxID=3055433 RepID=UPI002FD13255
MTKVALLIGVSEYEPGLNPLSAAVKDVAAMQRVLLDPEMGGFDQVKPLTNPDPQVMQYEIETLFSGRDKDDLVLLFFSGHGIKDDSGRLYFASRITRKNNKGDLIRSTAVPTSFVHDIMNNSRCRRQAIILDCCFSGAFDPSLQAKDDGSVDLRSQLGAEGRVVLTSSSSTEYSFEQQGADLSLYTRYLVEGIETGAADHNEDGFVSILELHEYAASKVRETAPKMTPKIIVLKDKGFEIVLSKARVTDPKLRYRKAASRSANAGSIRPAGRAFLNTLRQQLGLTSEEALEIETEVLRPYQERLANLQNYREALIAEAEHEYPLSEEAREDINRLQELLGLRDVDVLPIQQKIEAQFFQKSEAYQQHLTQYEQTFTEAIQREFPLSQQAQQNLENLQRSLELGSKDTARIEQPLLQQANFKHQENLRQIAEQQRQEQKRTEYENKLRRYEQEFSKAVQAEYPLSQAVLNGLKSFQQQLELKDEDVVQIEQPICEPLKAKYQEKLRQQEEAKQQQQAELEKRRKAEYADRLRRYEQEFSKAVLIQYPLDQAVIDRFKNFQRRLELKDEDVTHIEQLIYKVAEAEHHKRQEQERAEYENKLRRYKGAFSQAVQEEYPLSLAIGDELKRTQELLGLKKVDVAQIEQSVLQHAEAQYQGKLKQKQQEEAECERQAELEKRQKAEYETKLRRYEQELSQTVQTEYPLSSEAQTNFQKLQDSLGLTKKDVMAVNQRIFQRAEARYQSRKEADVMAVDLRIFIRASNLQRYEREFRKAIQAEYPLNQYVVDGLKNFQQQLGLKAEDVAQIEQQAMTSIKVSVMGTSSMLGIHLGVSHISVSMIRDGYACIVPNQQNSLKTPTTIACRKDGSWIIGQTAKNQASINSLNTYEGIVCLLGQKYSEISYENISSLNFKVINQNDEIKIECPALGRQLTPEEILAEGLRVLVDNVNKLLAQQFNQVVLSVPSCFTMPQRWAVERTARLAGLECLRLENSSTLASMAYGYNRNTKPCETILIADIDDASIITSILEIGDGIFETLSISGSCFLSGFKSNKQVFDSFETFTENALRDAKLTKDSIDRFILVGQDSRTQPLESVIRERFNKTIIQNPYSGMAVALGTALQVGVMAGLVKDVLLLDVTPWSLGVETSSGVMTKVIPRNTTIPTKKYEVFSTTADNQSNIEIQIFQGERELAKDNVSLGTFRLEGIPPAPRGLPQIEVTFDVDRSGLLSVCAKDKGTRKEIAVNLLYR